MAYIYPAIFSQQRDPEAAAPLMAAFSAAVGEILKWTTVQQLTVPAEGSGHQRIRNEAKVRAISRFLELDDRNSIPTAITVALRLPDIGHPEIEECSSLTIPELDVPPGIVIDGQHRLFGMADFDPSLPVNVVGLINPTDEEIAFQFLVINNKVTKVPTDHLKLLALHYEEEALGRRLRTARMVLARQARLVGIVDSSPDSPFYESVEWPTDDEGRNGLVLPASIEQALGAIAQKNLPDFREDDDALLEFFFTLWHVVHNTWPDLWRPDSRLLSKVGVVTLTTFVIDDLVPLADRDTIDLSNPSDVEREVREILSNLEPQFWTVDWSTKSLDTSTGRQLVVDSLVQIRRNLRREINWYVDVPVISTPPTAENPPELPL